VDTSLDGALGRVERRLDESLVDPSGEIAGLLGHLAPGGKRIRPRFAVATAAACAGSVPDAAITASAAIEILHLASLYHDDVVDGATHRRGRVAVHEQWTMAHAIVGGDLLIARSIELAAALGATATRSFTSAFVDLCRGQLLEILSQYDPDRSEASYFESIAGKTAALFRASCELGAIAAGADREVQSSFATFGHHIGMAFQVLDDLLDVTGTSDQLGKPAGNDLRQGVYTLPVILARDASDGFRSWLVPGRAPADVDAVVLATIEGGGVAQAGEVAAGHVDRARAAIGALDGLHPEGVRVLLDLLASLVGPSTTAVPA